MGAGCVFLHHGAYIPPYLTTFFKTGEIEGASLVPTDYDLALAVMKASGKLEGFVMQQQKGESMI